jgi:hypothetical protein
VTDLPPGESPADRVPVAELAKLAGIAPTHYYLLARQGLAPKPQHGVTFAEASAWLSERAAKKAKKAATVERLRSLYEAAGASGDGK